LRNQQPPIATALGHLFWRDRVVVTAFVSRLAEYFSYVNHVSTLVPASRESEPHHLSARVMFRSVWSPKLSPAGDPLILALFCQNDEVSENPPSSYWSGMLHCSLEEPPPTGGSGLFFDFLRDAREPSLRAHFVPHFATKLQQNFLQRLYRLSRQDDPADAIDLVLSELQERLDARDFALVDAWLASVDLERISTSTMVSFLAVTRSWGDCLPNRAALLARIEEKLLLLKPRPRVMAMLHGLR